MGIIVKSPKKILKKTFLKVKSFASFEKRMLQKITGREQITRDIIKNIEKIV